MGLQVPGGRGKVQGPGLIPGPRQLPPPLLRVLSDLFYPELHGDGGQGAELVRGQGVEGCVQPSAMAVAQGPPRAGGKRQ